MQRLRSTKTTKHVEIDDIMPINPLYEYLLLTRWAHKIIGQSITPVRLGHKLSKHLNSRHAVKVKTFYSEHMDHGDFCIGSEYDPHLDYFGEKHFFIYFIINWPKNEEIVLDKSLANRLVIDLVEALIHEYQHRHQYRQRGYNSYRNKIRNNNVQNLRQHQYLGHPDEIDAYATNIAFKLFLHEKTLNTVIEDLSLDLNTYKKTFHVNHPVRNRLYKKIFKHLNTLKNDYKFN